MALYIPDANILINSLRNDASSHHACRSWLLERAAKGDRIGMTEIVEIALLRICTHPKLALTSLENALSYWKDDLWSYKGVSRISAGKNHAIIFSELVTSLNLIGNDINDAWLAALAIENQATLVSLDKGFSKFGNLNWLNLSN